MPDSAVTGEDLPNPSTIMHTASDPTESRDFSADWLDFLDIHPVLDSSLHPENTYIIKVPLASTLEGSEEDFENTGAPQERITTRGLMENKIVLPCIPSMKASKGRMIRSACSLIVSIVQIIMGTT